MNSPALPSLWWGVVGVALCLIPGPVNGQLEQLLLKREAEVRELAVKAKELFDGRCSLTGDCGCSYETCKSTLPNLNCSKVDNPLCGTGQMKLDLSTSSVSLAPGSGVSEQVKESVCFGRALDGGPFRRFATTTIAQEPDSLQQMMFGSFTGSYRIFPGRGEASCPAYDPRIRPWYVAASSGPKDVLLVLDISGSMTSNFRMETLKLAVTAVLDTLTLTDYFNIITFSTDAEQILGRPDELIWASAENIRTAKEKVNKLVAHDQTNFYAAFEKAFKILNKRPQERTSNCQKMILFLTDGKHTNNAHSIDDVYTLVNSQNGNGTQKTPIFSYSLGAAAEEGPPKRLSCESGGVHAAIDDGRQQLREAMTHYYDFAAIGNYETYKNPSASTAKPVWVEPYEFASPPGVMGTTVALPIYDDSTRTLIGVAAIDVTVDSLVQAAGSSGQLLESLRTRSGKCHLPNLSVCQLEALRKKNGGDSNMCGQCALASDSSPLEPSKCDKAVTLSSLMCNANPPTQAELCCGGGGGPVGEDRDDRMADGTTEAEEEGGSGAMGAILGVVGGLVLLALIAGAVMFHKRQQRKGGDSGTQSHPPPNVPQPMELSNIQPPPASAPPPPQASAPPYPSNY